jgi:hypothetical protein
MAPQILGNFYSCTIERFLTGCITVWYGNCSTFDRKALQRVVGMAQRITGGELPAIQDILARLCLKTDRKIAKDSIHQRHGLFSMLPSGTSRL